MSYTVVLIACFGTIGYRQNVKLPDNTLGENAWQVGSNDLYSVRALLRELKKVRHSYSTLFVREQNFSGDSARYYYSADSLYEHLYSPLRLKIVDCWQRTHSRRVLKHWTDFILANPTDDGLDTKYLTKCFLSAPEEFCTQLNRLGENVKSRIVLYMTGSAGFAYATYENGVDYTEKLELFKRLVGVELAAK